MNIIDINYLNSQALKDEDIILQTEHIYSLFCDWAVSLPFGLDANQIYKLYVDKKLKNDGTILFYNFIKAFKYFEVNRLFDVGK